MINQESKPKKFKRRENYVYREKWRGGGQEFLQEFLYLHM